MTVTAALLLLNHAFHSRAGLNDFIQKKKLERNGVEKNEEAEEARAASDFQCFRDVRPGPDSGSNSLPWFQKTVDFEIQEFKEAFTMIDQNRDGFIDTEDLHDMLASLGKGDSF